MKKQKFEELQRLITIEENRQVNHLEKDENEFTTPSTSIEVTDKKRTHSGMSSVTIPNKISTDI